MCIVCLGIHSCIIYYNMYKRIKAMLITINRLLPFLSYLPMEESGRAVGSGSIHSCRT